LGATRGWKEHYIRTKTVKGKKPWNRTDAAKSDGSATGKFGSKNCR